MIHTLVAPRKYDRDHEDAVAERLVGEDRGAHLGGRPWRLYRRSHAPPQTQHEQTRRERHPHQGRGAALEEGQHHQEDRHAQQDRADGVEVRAGPAAGTIGDVLEGAEDRSRPMGMFMRNIQRHP